MVLDRLVRRRRHPDVAIEYGICGELQISRNESHFIPIALAAARGRRGRRAPATTEDLVEYARYGCWFWLDSTRLIHKARHSLTHSADALAPGRTLTLMEVFSHCRNFFFFLHLLIKDRRTEIPLPVHFEQVAFEGG